MLRSADAAVTVSAARGVTDWREIVDEAIAEGLAPLLARWLTPSQLPPAAAERLEQHCAGVAARNLLLGEELTVILGALEARGLRCAPLRGLALAERLYHDITVRPMGDIDLLVDKRDMAAVGGILQACGFRQFDRRPGFAHAFSYTGEFVKDRHGPIVVEPHWTIAYPPAADRIDMDHVWRRCRREATLGTETWRLDAAALLLHLCLHLVHRAPDAPYLWVYEIDRLIRREQLELDWTEFVELTTATGLAALVVETLSRVRAELGTPLPDDLYDRLSWRRAPWLERRLTRLLRPSSGVDGKESLALLFTLEGFRAKLGYVLALFFPTADFMMVQYGLTRRRQLGPAYLRRASRFSWEGMKGVVKLLV
jgi:hypothetical protein